MDDSAITNRELAALLIIGSMVVYAAWGQRGATARKAFVSVGAGLVSPTIAVSLGLYVAWVLLSLVPASRLGLWSCELLVPTILWWLFSGFGLILNLNDAVREPGYFRRTLLRTVGIVTFLEFFSTLKSFPLWVEIPTQAGAVVMVGVSVVARRAGNRPVRSVANGYLGILGAAALVWSAVSIQRNWDKLDRTAILREFALPLWLTPIALIFVYGLAVYSAQQTTWRLLRLHQPEGTIWRQRSAVLVRCNARLGMLRVMRGGALNSVARAAGFRGAWFAIGEARDRNRAQVDNTGLRGADDQG